MDRSSTGSDILDGFLDGGLEKGAITTIYGPAASGKSLICLITAIESAKTKKVIYIDTSKSFSPGRIKQLRGKEVLENILILKPKNFYTQKTMIENLKENITKDVGLIIINTLTYFYRLELAKDPNLINRVLASQINCLKDIAVKNNIPILVINQIYDDFKDKDNVKMLGGEILKRRSDCIIELKNYKTLKKAIMKIPNDKEILFKIEKEGITHH